jgi:hypothetical protein
MDIKEIEKLTDDIFSSEDARTPEVREKLEEILQYFLQSHKKAEGVVLHSITEKQFVRLILMSQKLVISAMTAEGNPEMFVVEQAMGDSITKYSHNLVLFVLGALYEDGVL